MKITLTLCCATLLATSAWAAAPAAPTPEQQQEISDCGIMAQAVEKFAEARDQGLSKPDAFKAVTQGQAVYKPGSRVDLTEQWAFAHPAEKPETVAAHFSGRCTLNALDLLNPMTDEELTTEAVACQKAQPDGIKPCILDKTSALITAANTPPPPLPATSLDADNAPASATVAAVPAATVAVPAGAVAVVSAPPKPIEPPAPTVVAEVTAPASPAPPEVAAAAVAASAPVNPVAAPLVPVVAVEAPRAAPVRPATPSPVAPVVARAAPAAPIVAVVAPAPVPPAAVVVPAPVPVAVVAPAPAPAAMSATVAGERPASFTQILKVTLGMPIRDARNSFDEAVQDVATDPQGDTDYTYMISDDHGFVDLFTSPGNAGEVAGVAINGGADVDMAPIMGIRLGDGAFEILTKFGPPDSKQAVPGTERTRWNYADRNYAFDVSSGGDVIGIRIYGYVGLPPAPAEPAQN